MSTPHGPCVASDRVVVLLIPVTTYGFPCTTYGFPFFDVAFTVHEVGFTVHDVRFSVHRHRSPPSPYFWAILTDMESADPAQ